MENGDGLLSIEENNYARILCGESVRFLGVRMVVRKIEFNIS